MTAETITKLTCNGCGKELEYKGDRPILPGPFFIEGENVSTPPTAWYKLEPNYKQSVWTSIDFSLSGDFCSLECIISFVQKKIKERDAPKITSGYFVKKGI